MNRQFPPQLIQTSGRRAWSPLCSSQHLEHERGGTPRALRTSSIKTSFRFPPPFQQNLAAGQSKVGGFKKEVSARFVKILTTSDRDIPERALLSSEIWLVSSSPCPEAPGQFFPRQKHEILTLISFFLQGKPFQPVNSARTSTVQPLSKSQHRPGPRRGTPLALQRPGVVQGLLLDHRPGVHVHPLAIGLRGGRSRERAEGEGQRDCLPQRDHGAERASDL